MQSYHINPQHYNQIFALPKIVAERYLASVCGYYLKVLLYVCANADAPADEQTISRKLSLSEEDVHEALEFWKHEKLLVTDIHSTENTEAPVKPPVSQEKAAPADNVRIISDRPPVLTSAEIAEKINKSCSLKFVFDGAEQLFGRPLAMSEQRSIISMHEWMNLPTDVILMIFEYCKSIEKVSIRYIEKVAATWCDLGITTHELAEEYISRMLRFNDQQKAVRECCGIHTRNLTSNEKKFIEIWFDEYQFNIDMIRLAFEKTADNIGKISFSYMNKILKQWHEAGFKTPEEAKNETAPDQKGKRRTSYDLDALDRIGLEIPEL